jgi:hypothetical protein
MPEPLREDAETYYAWTELPERSVWAPAALYPYTVMPHPYTVMPRNAVKLAQTA